MRGELPSNDVMRCKYLYCRHSWCVVMALDAVYIHVSTYTCTQHTPLHMPTHHTHTTTHSHTYVIHYPCMHTHNSPLTLHTHTHTHTHTRTHTHTTHTHYSHQHSFFLSTAGLIFSSAHEPLPGTAQQLHHSSQNPHTSTLHTGYEHTGSSIRVQWHRYQCDTSEHVG